VEDRVFKTRVQLGGSIKTLTRVKPVANSNIFSCALTHEGAFPGARHAHYKEESICRVGPSYAGESCEALGLIRHLFGGEIDLRHGERKTMRW
jgi:hypothetical protein